MKAAGETIEVNMDELTALLERSRQGPLGEEDYQKLKAAINTLGYGADLVRNQATTIRELRRLLLTPSTEKTKEVLQQAGVTESEKKPPPPPDLEKEKRRQAKPGHGRKGAEAYESAPKVKVAHTTLKPGEPCPECLKGKVYPLREPALRVRFKGQAPLQATVYELERLRCNLCGEVYEAEAPEGMGEEKYDATSASMIALLRYGSGFPFYRLAGWQENQGIPLPVSTQWGIMKETAALIRPAFEELIRQAAQGEVVHNDDTHMKILALARASPEEVGAEKEKKEAGSKSRERTGMFTSGIVSTRQGQRVALFFTGRKHAGENLAAVLARRTAELGPAIQMCDALSRNLPKLPAKLAVIVGFCLTHARRYFVDVTPSFPEECRYVLEALGEVYHYDAQALEQGLSPEARLHYHQAHSRPVMEKLQAWLSAQFAEKKVEPNSGLGEAISFMTKHWERLTLFLRQAGAPLDNSICERALKKAILMRKNSYFYKTQNGAQVGDLFLSLIHTCELNGGNSFDYLTELQKHAEELARNPAEWMPWNYRQTLARGAASVVTSR
jgi:transposase